MCSSPQPADGSSQRTIALTSELSMAAGPSSPSTIRLCPSGTRNVILHIYSFMLADNSGLSNRTRDKSFVWHQLLELEMLALDSRHFAARGA
jgi:hypothetical protein